jgi:hypothetical protein
LGNSQSGREIVLVPLADTTLFSINEGRARAQLVFSRSGPDTIFAQILLYAATPEYHAAHANNYNLNDFSGAFVFFDLFCNFQFGVAMNAGSPISFVDSIGYTQTNVVDDRTLVCTDYVDIFEVCENWTSGQVSVECTWEIHIYTFCTESGNGGGGGGGSGGGGSGGGGGGPIPLNVLNQYAYLAPLIQSGELTYAQVLLMGIPIHIFQYFGGQIPYNLNASQYNALVNLSTLCQFNDAQFQWVTEHTSLIPLMSNLLAQHNNAPAWIDALKDVIDARIGGTNLFSGANMAKLIEMQVSLGLTEEQLRWVIEHSKTDMPVKAVESIYDFLMSKNFDSKALEFTTFSIGLQMADSDYKWHRLKELFELVESNSNELVKNCDPHLQAWSDLASFVLSGPSLARVQNSNGNWDIQEIQNAQGRRVNLDEFSVNVSTLPVVNGQQLTANDLLGHIRKNINNFAPKFDPYSSYDANLWLGDNPLTSIMSIQMLSNPGLVDGDVITSQFDECCWVFTTLRGSVFESGDHPVSGNRQFGYRVTNSGFEFYTKGVDRTTRWWHGIKDSGQAFARADELWTAFQDNISQFVNSNGGNAPSSITTTYRPDWEAVKSLLKGDTPVTAIPCK